jgi:Holliday junction resolvase RusA-like endonuclease
VIRFEVLGTPVPQGSNKAFVHGTVARVAGPGKKLRSWRSEVADGARDHVFAHLKEGQAVAFPKGTPVTVGLVFRVALPQKFILPQGLRAETPSFPSTPADRDKLVRGVGDSLTSAGLVWIDDAQDAIGLSAKVYVPPGHWTGVVILVGEAETEFEQVAEAVLSEVRLVRGALEVAREATREARRVVETMREAKRALKKSTKKTKTKSGEPAPQGDANAG